MTANNDVVLFALSHVAELNLIVVIKKRMREAERERDDFVHPVSSPSSLHNEQNERAREEEREREEER